MIGSFCSSMAANKGGHLVRSRSVGVNVYCAVSTQRTSITWLSQYWLLKIPRRRVGSLKDARCFKRSASVLVPQIFQAAPRTNERCSTIIIIDLLNRDAGQVETALKQNSALRSGAGTTASGRCARNEGSSSRLVLAPSWLRTLREKIKVPQERSK